MEPTVTGEPRDVRIKRMRMRAMRRGIKEMDIVLSAYADDRLAGMSEDQLDLFDALMGQNDQDLLSWVIGQKPAPAPLAGLVADIAAHASRPR